MLRTTRSECRRSRTEWGSSVQSSTRSLDRDRRRGSAGRRARDRRWRCRPTAGVPSRSVDVRPSPSRKQLQYHRTFGGRAPLDQRAAPGPRFVSAPPEVREMKWARPTPAREQRPATDRLVRRGVLWGDRSRPCRWSRCTDHGSLRDEVRNALHRCSTLRVARAVAGDQEADGPTPAESGMPDERSFPRARRAAEQFRPKPRTGGDPDSLAAADTCVTRFVRPVYGMGHSGDLASSDTRRTGAACPSYRPTTPLSKQG